MCSKLETKTGKRRQRCRSGVVTVNFEHIIKNTSKLFLVFLLLTLITRFYQVIIFTCVNKEYS